jgi:hypothetical protein
MESAIALHLAGMREGRGANSRSTDDRRVYRGRLKRCRSATLEGQPPSHFPYSQSPSVPASHPGDQSVGHPGRTLGH